MHLFAHNHPPKTLQIFLIFSSILLHQISTLPSASAQEEIGTTKDENPFADDLDSSSNTAPEERVSRVPDEEDQATDENTVAANPDEKQDEAKGKEEASSAAPPVGLSGENVTNLNETQKTLFQIYKEMKVLREWIGKPYVHGVVLPAIIGVAAALITVSTVCCVHSCVRNTARRRRKVRIRNLADELKTDRAMLLADDGSDEEF